MRLQVAPTVAPAIPALRVTSPRDPVELEADRLSAAALARPAAPPTSIERGRSGTREEGIIGELGSRFGHDFSRIRIHADGPAAGAAAALNASAYTIGNDIVFGAGAYQPETPSGRRLLAHELAHVLQQDRVAHPGPQLIRRQQVPPNADPAPEPDPKLVFQFALTPLNFQLPLTGASSVFIIPPMGTRSTALDQAAQPNAAVGLNLNLHRKLSGFEPGLEAGVFAQFGPTFSLNASSLPTSSTGRTTAFTGVNGQLYIQPALIIWNRPEGAARSIWSFGADQFSVIAQPGVGRTWSDIPGLSGNAVTIQGGPQWTYNVNSWLQVTGTILGGYTWTFPDMGQSTNNAFVGLAIGFQGNRTLTSYPRQTPSTQTPAPIPTPTRPDREPDPTPTPQTTTGGQQAPGGSAPPPQPALPPIGEVFFKRDFPHANADPNDQSVLTAEGAASLPLLRQALQGDPTLKLQLIGSASSEGPIEHNVDLGRWRAEWVARALGVGSGRLVDTAADELSPRCVRISTGIYDFGAAEGAVDPHDRRVLVRWFH